jgi:hypothetical protein
MFQSLAEAGRAYGQRRRAFSRSSLVLTAVASGVVLSAGVAQAAPVLLPCPNDSVGGFTYTIITQPTILQPAPGGTGGTCDFSSPFPNQISAEIDFQNNLIDVSNGIFEYSVTRDDFKSFLQARLDSETDGLGGTTSVVKEIFGDAGFTNLIGTVTSLNGSEAEISLTNQNLSTIYVRDTYSSSGTTRLDAMDNTFNVPGPLPVLGAGAAFGFSRKLRGRIKAIRQA